MLLTIRHTYISLNNYLEITNAHYNHQGLVALFFLHMFYEKKHVLGKYCDKYAIIKDSTKANTSACVTDMPRH